MTLTEIRAAIAAFKLTAAAAIRIILVGLALAAAGLAFWAGHRSGVADSTATLAKWKEQQQAEIGKRDRIIDDLERQQAEKDAKRARDDAEAAARAEQERARAAAAAAASRRKIDALTRTIAAYSAPQCQLDDDTKKLLDAKIKGAKK